LYSLDSRLARRTGGGGGALDTLSAPAEDDGRVGGAGGSRPGTNGGPGLALGFERFCVSETSSIEAGRFGSAGGSLAAATLRGGSEGGVTAERLGSGGGSLAGVDGVTGADEGDGGRRFGTPGLGGGGSLEGNVGVITDGREGGTGGAATGEGGGGGRAGGGGAVGACGGSDGVARIGVAGGFAMAGDLARGG
jgi:hypothetical protein